MFESLRASRGESPNAAKIERVSAEVKAESRRRKVTPTSSWKDPFAEDPERPIPVYLSGRAAARGGSSKDPVSLTGSKDKELVGVKRELARARAETAVAQADAAKAQADAARVKANAARVEAAAAQVQATAARHEAVAARAACVVMPDRKKPAMLVSGSPISSPNVLAASASAGSTRGSNPARSARSSVRSSRSRDGFEEFAQGNRPRGGRRGRAAAAMGAEDPFMPGADQDGAQDDGAEYEAPVEEEPGPAAPLAESGSRTRGGIVVVPIEQP